jgi:hypothetical protein
MRICCNYERAGHYNDKIGDHTLLLVFSNVRLGGLQDRQAGVVVGDLAPCLP